MAAKSSELSPDKRRKYDEAFKAEALRLASESRGTQAAQQVGISPKLLYRWQQAQLVAKVGSVEVARDSEVRALRQPMAGLIVHSGQDSQYAATRFKELVARHKTLPNMNRRGNGSDNAHTESFWSRLKTELLDGESFPSLEEARLEISHYNAERRHCALGYQSPNYCESHLQTTSLLCPA